MKDKDIPNEASNYNNSSGNGNNGVCFNELITRHSVVSIYLDKEH